MLQKLQLASCNVVGSVGYKLCRWICTLIHCFSTPVLFITLNPYDLTSVILATLAVVGETSWTAMTAHQHAVFVAQHPEAAVCAFDAQINAFLHIIVCYGCGTGLFGKCKVYYGIVKVQGRGTLHCHMLLWLDGSPNPQLLLDCFEEDHSFQAAIFTWLEDIIKCKLPGMTKPLDSVCTCHMCNVEEQAEHDIRLLHAPQLSANSTADFSYQFHGILQSSATGTVTQKHVLNTWRKDSHIQTVTAACASQGKHTLQLHLIQRRPQFYCADSILGLTTTTMLSYSCCSAIWI